MPDQLVAIEELEHRQAIEALDLDVRNESRMQAADPPVHDRHKTGQEWWRSHEPPTIRGKQDPRRWMAWRIQGTLLYDTIACAHRLQRIWAELTDWQAACLAGDVALLCQAVDRAEAQAERNRAEVLKRAATDDRVAEAQRKRHQVELRLAAVAADAERNKARQAELRQALVDAEREGATLHKALYLPARLRPEARTA